MITSIRVHARSVVGILFFASLLSLTSATSVHAQAIPTPILPTTAPAVNIAPTFAPSPAIPAPLLPPPFIGPIRQLPPAIPEPASSPALIPVPLNVPNPQIGNGSSPPPSPGNSGAQGLLSPLTSGPAKVIGGLVGAATGNPSGLIQNVGTAIGSIIPRGPGGSIAEAIVWVADQVLGALNEATTPNLKAPWFVSHYRLMAWLAGGMLLLFIPAAIVGSVWKGDSGGIARAIAGGSLAVIAMFVVIGLLDIFIKFVDWMTLVVIQGSGDATKQFFSGTGSAAMAVASGSVPGAPWLVGIFVLILILFGLIFVGIHLLIRQAAIYGGAIFFPFTLIGLAWRPSSQWFKKLAWVMVAIVISKFVIAAIASLAISSLPSPDNGVVGMFRSSGMLMIAAFSPFALTRALMAGLEVVGGAAVLGHLRHPASGFKESADGVNRHFTRAKNWVSSGSSKVSSKVSSGKTTATRNVTRTGTATKTAGTAATGTGAATVGVLPVAAAAATKVATAPSRVASKVASAGTGTGTGPGNVLPSQAIPPTRAQVHQQILNQIRNTRPPVPPTDKNPPSQ